jgi:thiol-disulfide isomerase/thioredoxin
MCNKIKIFKKLVLSFVTTIATIATLSAQRQQSVTLDVGDKAPELRYAQWLKGTPIEDFENNRIYVVEFWATWCGPCIQQMPHLSKVAKEFEKDVAVVGVNIWEALHEEEKKSYESYMPRVQKFVKSMGDNMAYNVMSNNNAELIK